MPVRAEVRRIAVTGGRGKVGRSVVREVLAAGHEAVVIDTSPPPPDGSADAAGRRIDLVTDVRSIEAVREAIAGCQALVHLAAHPNPDHEPPWVVHHDNVVGSYNVLLAAAAQGIHRVVVASSVNYYGLLYTSSPRVDYLPIDEDHPTYNDDAYSLSKVLLEQQARSVARRFPQMGIAALRMHWVVPQRPRASWREPDGSARQLWGYVLAGAAARACLAAVHAPFTGFEPFLVVADDTILELPTAALAARYFPDAPVRRELPGRCGLFDTTKARTMLGWQHDLPPEQDGPEHHPQDATRVRESAGG